MAEATFPIQFDADTRRDYPLEWPKCARAVPLEAVSPHERQADRNHGQTLQRLAERGGLSPTELVAVMHGVGFYDAWPRYVNGFWKKYKDENRRPHPDHLRAVLFVNALAAGGDDPHRMCDKRYCAVQRARIAQRERPAPSDPRPGNCRAEAE
jgi:hypothetical protein